MSDQRQFTVDSSEENGTLFTNDQQSVVSVTFTASGTWNTGSKIDYGPEGKVGAHNPSAAYPKSTLYALVAVNSNNEVVGEGATIKLPLQPDESVRFVVNDTHYPNNSGQLTVDWESHAATARQLPAADNEKREQAVEHPTWCQDIRHFFSKCDIEHMAEVSGMDLATYEGVKRDAVTIYYATKPPRAHMPPDRARKWSRARSDTFDNWIADDYPYGTPYVDLNLSTVDPSATRIRRDIRTLSQDELNKLKQAFEGIMALDPKGPGHQNSYFDQAGIHWLPLPHYCVHLDPRFLAWHRVYLQSFEDALRSVSGCQDVTLPYWDMTEGVPPVLYECPFDKYTVPEGIGAEMGSLHPDKSTWRNLITEVEEGIEQNNIAKQIERAESQSTWEDFARILERRGHNPGHNLIGPTMRDADTAAFDPIFWFFHANWDRIWWKWQRQVSATDVQGLLSVIKGDHKWLTDPKFNQLPNFSKRAADQTIDLVQEFSVDYEQPTNVRSAMMLKQVHGSGKARKTVRLNNALKASVRVKGIDRLNIPGSFIVHLRADGQTIARQSFFQSRNPRTCSNCNEKGFVNFDFEVEVSTLRGRDISVAIELAHPHWISQWFPLSRAGDPTINVRLLLHDE